MVVESLRELVKRPNLGIYYVTFPFGLDGALPITNKATEFFLKTRDPHHQVTGGIYIKSPVIVPHIKKVYDDTVKESTRVTSMNVGQIISNLKRTSRKYTIRHSAFVLSVY